VSASERSNQRLLALWEIQPEFGDPVSCVATTFTFDPDFFETECLGRFTGIDSDPQEDGAAYIVEREEKLSGVKSIVLVDQAHVGRARSLRWHLLPARVTHGGVLHAKVSLLRWSDRIRLVVSSANLTQSGYRENFEFAAAVDFTKDEGPRSLLRDAVAFLERCARRCQGMDLPQGPGPDLREILNGIRTQAAAWRLPEAGPKDVRPVFVSVEPGAASLFEQTTAQAWHGPAPEEAWILSPFYSDDDTTREVTDALLGQMAGWGDRELWFFAPGNELPDGSFQLGLPAVLKSPWGSRARLNYACVEESDADSKERRRLHAKGLMLIRGRRATFVVGSSNFTGPGTGASGGCVNVEANIAYEMPPSDVAFFRACDAAFPPHQKLASDSRIAFGTNGIQTPEPNDGAAVLPAAFGAALFEPQADGGLLHLGIGGDPPQQFTVCPETGESIYGWEEWTKAKRPTHAAVQWGKRRPPSFLLVRWPEGPMTREAVWVVNVTDTSALPPVEELRSLSLEVLLDILTSARPLHVALREARAREASNGTSRRNELDALRRVDTHGYLLKRVRRVAAALEGLRDRLSRPALTLEALRWRLHGPVGPVALARRIATEDPAAAAFLVAEVALTVSRVHFEECCRRIDSDRVATERRLVLRELEGLARGLSAPENLRAYVKACFSEAKL
jgi:hypothetical protein